MAMGHEKCPIALMNIIKAFVFICFLMRRRSLLQFHRVTKQTKTAICFKTHNAELIQSKKGYP